MSIEKRKAEKELSKSSSKIDTTKKQKESERQRFDFTKMKYNLSDGWKQFFDAKFYPKFAEKISEEIQADYDKYDGELKVYPPMNLVFNAFEHTPLDKIKVVIVGQDPYIREGQAMGMSFSVPDDVKMPPSLKNIFKELIADDKIEFKYPSSGNLTKWADRGVFLINASLTVREGRSNSHFRFGWNKFTQSVIEHISNTRDNIVFMLWGRDAEWARKYIDLDKHRVLMAGHPSPLNRTNPFIGCRHFSKCNEYLESFGFEPVNWNLTE